MAKGDALKPKIDDAFRKAETTSREELEHTEFVAPNGLPTSWSGADGKTHLRGQNARVITPDGNDIRSFGGPQREVCGHCKYFDLEEGRKEIVRQKFGEKLVHEYEWKLKHLGPIDAIALCGASGGETAVTFVSAACDQFRPRT
jgi:hypothetical protein